MRPRLVQAEQQDEDEWRQEADRANNRVVQHLFSHYRFILRLLLSAEERKEFPWVPGGSSMAQDLIQGRSSEKFLVHSHW
jgi:hypothetical protein